MAISVIILLVAPYRLIIKGEKVMTAPIKPGSDNKPAETYIEVGPRGGSVSNPRVVKIDPGDRLPPTQEKGRGWKKQ